MSVPISEDSVYSLIEIAMQEANSGNFVLAEQLLMRSYGSLESQKQHCNELRARVFHLLANSYRDRGKLKVAREFYDKASQVFKSENFVSPSLAFYDDIYIQALWEDDLDLALSSQQDLYKIMLNSGCQPLKSRMRNLLRLAAVFWAQKDYANADKYLREYLQLAIDANTAGSHEYISVLGFLGLIAFRMGNLEEAESLYKGALTFTKKLGSLSDSEQAELLNQLGLVLCSQDRHHEAQEGCKKAEELREPLSDETSKQLRSIADVYCTKNCFDEASKYCRSALDVVEMGSGTESFPLILRRLGMADDASILECLSEVKQPQSVQKS